MLLLLIPLIISLLSSPSYAACTPLDHDSLLSFSLNFAQLSNWSSFSSSGVNCCDWDKGIGCDINDRVTRLSLPSIGLHGPIPSSILNLTSLLHLDLSQNSLSGFLPSDLFTSLTNLQFIDLSYNLIAGSLPDTSSANNIQTLNISSNQFNGTLQASAFQSSLISFNISTNNFIGPIPNPASICSTSPLLLILDFSFNIFNGVIPQGFGTCSNLQVFRVEFNNFTGLIPSDIYSSGSLQELFLAGNHLSGEIDNGISSLTNLKILSLFGNQLTGLIPTNIGKLSKLEQLLLHINNITGTLPSSLTNCTNLKILNLRVNKLGGVLSDFDFSKFVHLTTLDLGDNNFTGPLPPTLFNCKSLTAIRFANNKLVGDIPPQVAQLQSLSFFSLSYNGITNITGALTNLMGLKNLSVLILSKNNFNESIPSADIQGFQNLRVLAAGGCNLTGEFPSWVATLANKLEVLDLSVNNITGSIPGWLGNFQYLFYIDLSQNYLSGGLPDEIAGLPRLESQQGTDQLESYLALPVFVQPYNASYLQYNQLANLPPAIYLGNNSLGGNIPANIGQLKFLHVLDLSNNNFSGNIPLSVSNLTNLEQLNLSGNDLSGEIPAALKNLHFLSSFSVANNKLDGSIPTGGQFDTFTSANFEGNPGLCGAIIHRPCTNQTVNPSHSSGHKKGPNKKIIVGLILGICLIVGLALTLLALWVLSKRRILPRGDPDKIELGTLSFNSTSGTTEFGKDASIVVLFPSNTKEIKDLSISEILNATENFSQANIVGCGGFGLVYKATFGNGVKLAVKKLSGDMGLMEREFKAEVEALSTAQHKNLVSLQGYCVHDGYRLLIYSYMENGSLDYWLHEKMDGPSKLDWPTRLKIARGAGCGLAYMHQVCEPHIIHRDIKSSNILLDEKFEAYVADFGLSRLILPYQTHVTTELVGTLGYIPPEYSQSWIATMRGDVYSFGVVILELLTGKRPMEVCKPKTSRELVVWVQQLRTEGKPEEIFDPLLRGKGFEEEMLQVLDVACMCVNRNPFKRPTINEIVDWLENVGSKRQMQK